MNQSLTIILLSLLCGALFAVLLLLLFRKKSGTKGMSVHISTAIEELKAIGILSVFKAVTKEIVTAKNHSLGEFGKRHLEWLLTSKKMAMIFEFDIDFQYNLCDPSFTVQEENPGHYLLQMPYCDYVVHLRDVTFYDEQSEKWLPILLPEVFNKMFAGGFNEADRNKLKAEARVQAEECARNLYPRLRSEVQTSARTTMEMLAKSFNAKSVRVVFSESKSPQVDSVKITTQVGA